MLWRGSLAAKWVSVAFLVAQALWTGAGALLTWLEMMPHLGDASGTAVIQGFTYGLAAWTLFSIAAAVVLTLSPSVQEFLRVQRTYYGKTE